MTAVDYDQLLYTAVAGISSFAAVSSLVKANNFLFEVGQTTTAKRFMANLMNDWPQVRLVRQSGTDMIGTPRTFNMQSVDYVVPQTKLMRLTCIHDSTDQAKAQPLEFAIDQFFHSKLINFGFNWVARYNIRLTRSEQQNKDTGDALRLVSQRLITFDIRPYLSTLY